MSSPRSGDMPAEYRRGRADEAIASDEQWMPAEAEARRVQELIASLRLEFEAEDIVGGPALEVDQ